MRILKELLQLTGVKKHVVSALNPQGNGQVEIFNKSLKKFLRCFVSELTDDWEAFLAPLQLAHNTALCKSTHTTPYSLMFNQEPSMPWSLQLTTYSQTDSAQKFRMLQYTRQMAIDRNVEARKAYTRAYNERASSRTFQLETRSLCIILLPPRVLILNCTARGRGGFGCQPHMAMMPIRSVNQGDDPRRSRQPG